MTHTLFNGLTVPYEPQGSRIDEFYRNGASITNTITVGSNGDKGGLYLSFANLKSTGIIPGNSFDRKTLNLGFSYDLTEKLAIRGNINYSNEYNKIPQMSPSKTILSQPH